MIIIIPEQVCVDIMLNQAINYPFALNLNSKPSTQAVLMVNGDGESFVEDGVLVEKVRELFIASGVTNCSCFKEF